MRFFLISFFILSNFNSISNDISNFYVNDCDEFFNNTENYFYEFEIQNPSEFKFNSEVDKILKEGLINKIITKIDLASSLETSNIDGVSKSTFNEKITLESSGILFDLNYKYCKRDNLDFLVAYINKDIFNISSKRSFENKIISLNNEIDLIFDQLIFNKELLFENEIDKISKKLSFMDKNMLFLNNINIEYDLVYAYNNLKSNFGKLKSKIKTFEYMKNELMNFLLNSNIDKAEEIYFEMKTKFGNEKKFKKGLSELKKKIRKNSN